ncbi:MAG: DUF59 domain-containing protein [Alphaproteobacteria bacterium]|nr:MAG: DUF59 domain-containing protein [Alphaproteobacteria bacterium]
MPTIYDEHLLRSALRHIPVPWNPSLDVVSAGLISGFVIRGANVGVMVTIEPQHHAQALLLQQKIEATLGALEGVEKVTVVLTAHHEERATETPPPPAPTDRKKAVWNHHPVAHVRRVIAIASGKGGVGKSTLTAWLALSLAQQGYRVGVLDADIYGPSIPLMMGLDGAGKPRLEGTMMIPHVAGNVRCMSVGFLLERDQAAIMRGPMISKTMQQLVRGTIWGSEDEPLDVLLVDMPPGTGDIHLSMVQQIPLSMPGSGAILVTTPQEMAVIDARKCLIMFQKTNVPVLGVIENMSYVQHPQTLEKMRIFGEGGGMSLAQQADAPLMAQCAMYPELRAAADAGKLPAYVAMTGGLAWARHLIGE